VFIFFAGHGVADGARFYLIPHDLGYAGPREVIDNTVTKTIEQHGISDEDMDAALESVDAGHIVLVIDACDSGQALGAERSGSAPSNSKGLAQLGYDKGMDVLTAAQGYQQAQEVTQFGHGLLTYALVQEGLVQGRAAGILENIYLRDWLDYAVREVPQLQSQWLAGALNSHRGFKNVNGKMLKPLDRSQSDLQHPRVFYRRELETNPLIIGRRSTDTRSH
jgi:hypothetical protein